MAPGRADARRARTGVGALEQKNSGSMTMLLQWPDWITYLLMTGPIALTALMALYTAITGHNGSGAHARDPLPGGAPLENR